MAATSRAPDRIVRGTMCDTTVRTMYETARQTLYRIAFLTTNQTTVRTTSQTIRQVVPPTAEGTFGKAT